MTKKDRSDRKNDTFEKRHGIPQSTVRNKDDKDTREDKRIGAVRKEKD